MASIKLTDAKVKSLRPPPKPKQDEYFDKQFPSLAVRVSYGGQKSFVLFDRINGKLRRMTLGAWPTMTVGEARRKARDWKTEVQRGLDPLAEEARREAVTFATTVEQYLKSQGNRLREETVREYRRFLTGPDTAALANRPLEEITRADVGDVLDKIGARGPAMCDHALAYLRRFFRWCEDRDLIDRAPTDRVRARYTKPSRDRHLSADELATVLEAMTDDDTLEIMHGVTGLPTLTGLFRDFFMVLLLTGQRRGEVAGMTWAEVDLDGTDPQWVIPGARTKNHREHVVPLGPAVVAILKRRKQIGGMSSSFAFSGYDRGPLSGFAKAKAALDGRITAVLKVQGAKPMPSWTLHDLRRTMVTMMSEAPLSIQPHVVEAVVNHISGTAKAGVAGVYNRALYLWERRVALEAWADYVRRLSGVGL